MEIDYRYERKFRVEAHEASMAEVLAAVRGLPALFRPAFPDRWVNSMYLDTPDRQAFQANAAGLAERAKPRIRWYSAAASPMPPSGARLEIKRRHGLVGTKELLPLAAWPPAPGAGSWRRYAAQHPWLRLHPELEPAVLISYRRTYLVSADGRFRLTLDREMRYAAANQELRAPVRGAFVGDAALVLELKYPLTAADDAPSLPFRLTRNSKYVVATLNVDR
jgi:VTC domain